MQSQSGLTIVIVTRNRQDSLLRTLNHIVGLEDGFPIVVVDNASEDDTLGFESAILCGTVRRRLAAAARCKCRIQTMIPKVNPIAHSFDRVHWVRLANLRSAHRYDYLTSVPA